jgi:hypothetical protein
VGCGGALLVRKLEINVTGKGSVVSTTGHLAAGSPAAHTGGTPSVQEKGSVVSTTVHHAAGSPAAHVAGTLAAQDIGHGVTTTRHNAAGTPAAHTAKARVRSNIWSRALPLMLGAHAALLAHGTNTTDRETEHTERVINSMHPSLVAAVATSDTASPWTVPAWLLDGTALSLKLDTQASVNLLPHAALVQLHADVRPEINSTGDFPPLTGFDHTVSSTARIVGRVTLPVHLLCHLKRDDQVVPQIWEKVPNVTFYVATGITTGFIGHPLLYDTTTAFAELHALIADPHITCSFPRGPSRALRSPPPKTRRAHGIRQREGTARSAARRRAWITAGGRPPRHRPHGHRTLPT